ncbi:MAG: hypothetical protein QNL61_07445 [Crocinitomicaceae bacterium]
MATSKLTQKLQAILNDLQSKDEKKVSKAIKSLESHGNAHAIKSLAEVLLSSDSEQNKNEVLELLSSLKDTSTVVEMIEVIADKTFLPIRQALLSTIWNMKVDFSDYVDDFVEIAAKGDFLEALDCLTIIENLEGPFMEENILECQLHLKNYMEVPGAKDERKAEILSEIAIKIRDFNQDLQD